MAAPQFESVLVTNRGEIAVRVMRTCRRLGMRTIGVYSDADAHALHVAHADEAYRIGPPPATESYLNSAAILEVAQRAGAAAVHPGYGFLAENPTFAEACIATGLVWIGPPPAAMRAVGDKAHAKTLAEKHGVPLLPGYHGEDQSLPTLLAEAQRIGFPVLIKASAGGGGRGMRVVESSDAFGEALEAAKGEAVSSFGDDRVLLERYVRRPRHVEIQILADAHGNVVHLGERECSIQRRHQKLIEESPSPAVDADLRAALGDAAIRLTRAAGYTNAGTVEFLLDESRAFAFLEVNARLQVEHPVTEQVTGLDLVEQQVRIAAGESLAFSQTDVRLDGHAIEVRIIAEDALAGFLPSSGTISAFALPSGVRVDTWVRDGTTVSPYYDSLLAKVIAHRKDRPHAVRRLAAALRKTTLEGVRHNVDLLLSSIEHPSFVLGELYTGFLDEHAVLDEVASLPAEVLAASSALEYVRPALSADPWRGPPAWRLGRLDQPAAWSRAWRTHTASVSALLDGHGVEVDNMLVRWLGDDRLSVDGHAVTVHHEGDRLIATWRGRSYRLQRPPPLSIEDTAADRVGASGSGRLTAPMPGRIARIAVDVGQRVRSNQPLLVLEAMKMEHIVDAPHAGVVQQVLVEVGQQVAAGAVLLELGSVE